MSAASTVNVKVTFTTRDGTARAPADYTAVSAKVMTFPPATTSKTVKITAVGDSVVEPDETFSVVLSSPSGATIADGTGVGTIVNDD